MVLDTRTLDSLYALADVVRDYTTPSRGSRELTDEEKDQACRLRAEHGWHAWHIAEALGLGPGTSSKAGVGRAWGWEENVVEALEGCMYRRDWGGSSGRLIRGLGRTAARGEELHPSEVTVEGPNDLGGFRTTARRNAIIQAFLSPGQTGTPDIPGAGGRARQIGRPMIKAGRDKSPKEIVAQANAIIANEIRGGLYKGIEMTDAREPNVTTLARELGDLIDWQGRLRILGIDELPEEEKQKIDAEFVRRCKEQAKITPERPPRGWYGDLANDVYLTFKCCGPDGNETMEEFGYQPIQRQVPAHICRDDEKIFKSRSSFKAQVDDPSNQKKVKDAIAGLTTPPVVEKVMKQTGFTRRLVIGILAELGHQTLSARNAALKKIIMPLHTVSKLTPAQIWDHSPELQKLMPDRADAAHQIWQLLMSDKHVPWTAALLRAERQVPELAFNIKDILLAHLRGFDDDEVKRIQGNLDRVQLYFEETNISVDDMAQSFTRPGRPAVTPEIVRGALELLFTETPQLVTYHPDRPDEIVLHREGLREFVGRGR